MRREATPRLGLLVCNHRRCLLCRWLRCQCNPWFFLPVPFVDWWDTWLLIAAHACDALLFVTTVVSRDTCQLLATRPRLERLSDARARDSKDKEAITATEDHAWRLPATGAACRDIFRPSVRSHLAMLDRLLMPSRTRRSALTATDEVILLRSAGVGDLAHVLRRTLSSSSRVRNNSRETTSGPR